MVEAVDQVHQQLQFVPMLKGNGTAEFDHDKAILAVGAGHVLEGCVGGTVH